MSAGSEPVRAFFSVRNQPGRGRPYASRRQYEQDALAVHLRVALYGGGPFQEVSETLRGAIRMKPYRIQRGFRYIIKGRV